MTDIDLQSQLTEVVEELRVPGAAAGILHGGVRRSACHGVTSVENPLALEDETFFQIGSTAKTFTATTLMRLVADGRVELEERVRTYIPELQLQDEHVADEVTVLHLLNHTAGWDGDYFVDTGEGDDALERYVAKLVDRKQSFPVGAAASYNNAAFAVAGRVIEKVTGQPYERALEQLVLAPLGLTQTLTSVNGIMTRRFSAGHDQDEDGSLVVHRPWSDPRAETAMSGRIASTIPDLLQWASFHLGHGLSHDGVRLLPDSLVRRMQAPTTDHELMPGMGIGIAWLLREVDGVRVVEHPGDVAGQQSAFTMVPERDWAIVVLANSSPNGQELKNRIVRWALEADLGLVERDPEPLDLGPEEHAEYLGAFGAEGISMQVTAFETGLMVTVSIDEPGGTTAPANDVPIGMLDAERFIVVGGPFKGYQGHFVRDGVDIVALALAGRVVPRVHEAAGQR